PTPRPPSSPTGGRPGAAGPAPSEGPVALTECALGDGRCSLEHDCATRANWRVISQAVQVALEAVSLADMAAPRLHAVQFSSLHHQPRKA
ncbi:MAG: hypothetical protein ACUVT2_02825, partial [Thiobacillaceae bacterium]